MKAKLTPEEIKTHINIADVVGEYVSMKKNGLNYFGSCPFHQDKTPSFSVNETKQMFYCFGCGAGGDVYEFLIKINNMSFAQAYMHLADRVGCDTTELNNNAKHQPREFTPTEHQNPADLWQEKAEKFVVWAQENLSKNQQQMDWLAARGIDRAAAESARLGWNPGENGKDIFRARKAWGLPEQIKENGKPRMLWIPQGLVIPYASRDTLHDSRNVIQRLRIRRPDEIMAAERAKNPDKEPVRYYVVPGSAMSTMIIGADRKAFVIVESELDAIACAAATELAGAVGLGSAQQKPDAAAFAVLKNSLQILNALDYDRAGANAYKWWGETFNNTQRADLCERWPVPKGKDPGEAHAAGIALKSWIESGVPPVVKVQGARAVVSAPVEKKQINHQPEMNKQIPEGTPPLLAELWKLLRANPSVKIINTADRFTILKNGKYVPPGSRIRWLVTREKDVTEYIFNHPAEIITWENLLYVSGS